MTKKLCACCSGKLYTECCQPYHLGLDAPTALALMRSRYCAYALNLPDYIIATTHPQNPQYRNDLNQWKNEIAAFSETTVFKQLEILEATEEAFVTFHARLTQKGRDASFTECSCFKKIGNRWLYFTGMMS